MAFTPKQSWATNIEKEASVNQSIWNQVIVTHEKFQETKQINDKKIKNLLDICCQKKNILKRDCYSLFSVNSVAKKKKKSIAIAM